MLSLVSVSPATRNPYFNMVEETNKKGFFKLIKTASKIKSRQKAPEVFELNASFYWYKREFFNLDNDSPITNKTGIYKVNHICFDLDTPLDFKIMEFLICNNELDFKL